MGPGAGLRLTSRPLFLCALIVCLRAELAAQEPLRPWLEWRTISTANHRFHFPRELEQWTRFVAERVESIDSAVALHVGYSPEAPVHVVVDDPFNIANGYVLPFIDRPVTVWWAMPADPRSGIGNYLTWGETLGVHELAHLAHLTRPSRNPLQRQLWASLPANLGPIARKTPRWAYEGYATTLEGLITGTGRPNNVWRPAILRQWAIEGRLPSYSELSAWDEFIGGEFAYLSGSAFLEWLTRREGDSSLVHVWRRLTARRVRGFDAAFTGVFGDAPRTMYGWHVAELTRDAMLAKAELERDGLVEGELIQRLTWGTGDPAVSPNGKHVALILREPERPGRLVVWKTEREPEDTAELRKRVEELKRDPQDVADRRFYPLPKKPEMTLPASNGRSYQHPRWFADGRRILVTRWAPRGDETLRPDLYVWDTERDDVRRVTRGAGVLHGDPSPDGRHAVAMRCGRGHCDIARVDLARGAISTVLEGAPHRSYYRPRYSPDGLRFAAAVSDSGRWRIVVADADGGNERTVDADDGYNRYDAEWLPGGDSLVVVSERGGIANLELVVVSGGEPRTLTRVTGAAVAPTLNHGDGSIWYLSLHSRGFDVRRLARDSGAVGDVVFIGAETFGFAGVRGPSEVPLGTNPISGSRAYGAGPRHQRWVPGAYGSADGWGGTITIFSGDIVGRLNGTVTGAFGARGAWKGAALRAAWRYPRPALEFGAHGLIHEPALGRWGHLLADTLDMQAAQGLVALSHKRAGDGWQLRLRSGGGAGIQGLARDEDLHFRGLGFGEAELQMHQIRGSRGLIERLRLHAAQGHALAAFQRAVGTLEIATTGQDLPPLELSATLGRMVGSPHRLERFAIGGSASPITDSSLMRQRYNMPALPTGIASGEALFAWRASIPSSGWGLFYEAASVAPSIYEFARWHRAIGVELRLAVPPVPAAFSPRVQIRQGFAYTLDEPFRKRVRAYLEMSVEP